MRFKDNRVWAYISGDPRLFTFEHQIFNSILLFTAIASIPLPLINHFMDYGFELTLLTAVFSLFCFVVFYFSRVQKKFESVVFPTIVILILLLSAAWFYNGGSTGGAQYFFVTFALVIIVISDGLKRIFLLLFFLLVSLSVIILEYLHPQLIHAYSSRESRYIDVAISFVLAIMCTVFIAVIVMNKYVYEREKNRKLLLNILPFSVADELNHYGKTKPVSYELATVMFADFVNFTTVAEKLDHSSLLAELDMCFTFFDSVTKKYNLEKIKTIGDSYMVCGGLPVVNRTNPVDCTLAALEIKYYIEEKRKNNALHFDGIRIGIHSGPLIAGVIGDLKFSYDVFGDTVNVASRIESSGMSGEINISEKTYLLIKDFFDCEYRGKVTLKGKDECSMYIVKGVKPELSEQEEGETPNRNFYKVLNKNNRFG